MSQDSYNGEVTIHETSLVAIVGACLAVGAIAMCLYKNSTFDSAPPRELKARYEQALKEEEAGI